MRSTAVVIGLLAIALACGWGALHAQSEDPPSATSSIGDETINQMADAYLAIHQIHKRAAEALNAAQDQATAQAVIESAERAIIQAVERTGLELEEFNRLVELAALDPTLALRIEARMRERAPI